MIVTIDGPAGAGKSTAARVLARRLGFEFLDTGAMYRSVALAAQRQGIAAGDAAAMSRLLDHLRLDMRGGRVLLADEDITPAIRTPEITALSRAVADSPTVREHLGGLQRSLAAGKDLVTEGRDQGTIVFPEAECKFFLIADAAARARRRCDELRAKGEMVELAEVLRQQEERDRRDAGRAIAPMTPAADAVLVDSTGMTADEVVDFMEQHVRARLRVGPDARSDA
jgi:cytidylate kinase